MAYSVKTSQLNDSLIAEQFYEERYNDGYMDEWPQWKKLRIIELIQQLNLPKQGKALDFGCGRGIFTQVIKQALPNWEVTGCDISPTALADASKKFPHLRFLPMTELIEKKEKFDFVFSHHVLEHVFEIKFALNEISQLQNKEGLMFHILPCGNLGSFEHDLASKIPGGIDPENGNRFYFEDVGHVRRLTSNQLESLVDEFQYKPHKAWFANQRYGALEWMSDSSDSLINEVLTNPSIAKGNPDGIEMLAKLRETISRLKLARLYAKEGKKHRVKMRLIELKSKPSSFFKTISSIFNDIQLVKEGIAFQENLSNEWSMKKTDSSGSEMYLSYKKAK